MNFVKILKFGLLNNKLWFCLISAAYLGLGISFCLLIYSSVVIYLAASLVSTLDDDSLKLYALIWKRTMACQMEASRAEMIQVDIGNSKGDMIFHSSASNLDFKGYQAVYDVSCTFYVSMLLASSIHSEHPV
jgi:hypothetical protein